MAWDIEGPDLEKAVALYKEVSARYAGKPQALKAKERLVLLEPRLKMEIEARSTCEALVVLSKQLKDVPGEPSSGKAPKWALVNKTVIEKLRKGTADLYKRLPDTMGAARARGLCEKLEIAEGL